MNWFKYAQNVQRFQSTGTLSYPGQSDSWVVLYVSPDLCKYYKSLIPKSQPVQPQKYPCHITVVRLGKEEIVNKEAWGKYEGEIVPFEYENRVYISGPYYTINAWSPRLEEIREELGLPSIRTGFSEFHITIGNAKHSI